MVPVIIRLLHIFQQCILQHFSWNNSCALYRKKTSLTMIIASCQYHTLKDALFKRVDHTVLIVTALRMAAFANSIPYLHTTKSHSSTHPKSPSISRENKETEWSGEEMPAAFFEWKYRNKLLHSGVCSSPSASLRRLSLVGWNKMANLYTCDKGHVMHDCLITTFKLRACLALSHIAILTTCHCWCWPPAV